jgi:hypothetical protein
MDLSVILTFGSSGFSSKFFGSHTHTSAIAGQFWVYSQVFCGPISQMHTISPTVLVWPPLFVLPSFLASRETCLEIFIFFLRDCASQNTCCLTIYGNNLAFCFSCRVTLWQTTILLLKIPTPNSVSLMMLLPN